VRFYHSKWFRRCDAVAFAAFIIYVTAMAWRLI